MFRKVLRLSQEEGFFSLENQFGFRSILNRRQSSLKKRRALKKDNLVTQDVKKALMSADQNVIVMVRG